MTHPLTPREKVAALKTNDPTNPAHRLASDLQAGHFAAGESRDDLIEVLSNLPRYAALVSGSGDHAELARSAEEALLPIPEKRRKSWFNRQNRFRDAANPATVLALLAENAALRERLETARIARAAHNRQYEELRAGRIHLVEQKEGAEDALFDALTRATEAERKLAEADRAARQIVELKIPPGNDPEQRLKLLSLLAKAQVIARTFLSKEAERG